MTSAVRVRPDDTPPPPHTRQSIDICLNANCLQYNFPNNERNVVFHIVHAYKSIHFNAYLVFK